MLLEDWSELLDSRDEVLTIINTMRILLLLRDESRIARTTGNNDII